LLGPELLNGPDLPQTPPHSQTRYLMQMVSLRTPDLLSLAS